MIKYFTTLTNKRGDVLAGYRVQVVTSAGATVPIYRDASGTVFTANGATVNYCTADPEGLVEFYWVPALGHVLQTLDPAGNLIKSVSNFSDVAAEQVQFVQTGAGAAVRPALEKMREIRSSEDYTGADDLAKIQAAINAAVAGETVILTRASYIMSGTLALKAGVTLDLNGSTLTGKAGVQFEYMVTGTNCDRAQIKNGTIDINAAARIGGGPQTTRMCGVIWFGTSNRCVGSNLTVMNAIGFGGVPGVLCGSSGSTFRCGFVNCFVYGGGTSLLAADGFFMSGFAPFVLSSQAEDCWDTGFVLESCDYGLVAACTSLRCSAGGAITNALATDKRGNRIVGLTVSDWLSTNTGGVQIGSPVVGPPPSAGNLIDSHIDVIMQITEAGRGIGPAIRVRQEGGGRVKGLTIKARINGATTQGILVDGDDVKIEADIKGVTENCIQFQTGSSGRVEHSKTTGGLIGLAVNGTAVVDAIDSDFNSAGHGAYAFGTSTLNLSNTRLSGNTVAPTGKDAGATLTRSDIRDGVLKIDGTQVVGSRKTGWTAATGTVSRAAYATYTAPAASAAYVQAELQAVMDALQAASRRMAAMEQDLRLHGLIN